MMESKGEIIIYDGDKGQPNIEVRVEGETVWLTQEQMAVLFGKGRSTVTEHIANVYKEGELNKIPTCRKFRQVRQEGLRGCVNSMLHESDDGQPNISVRVENETVWLTQAQMVDCVIILRLMSLKRLSRICLVVNYTHNLRSNFLFFLCRKPGVRH
jgi:hypothetical protein